MGTATKVPQTSTMPSDELSADDAWRTLKRTGEWALVRDSFRRFRYADGFSHARALALQVLLAAIPGAIAAVGLSATMHQSKVSEVVRRTLSELTPGSTKEVVNRTLSDSKHAGSGGSLALWLGLLFAVVAVTTAMGQIERGANRIYGVERDRPTMKKYARALLMAGTAGLLMTLGALVLIAGPAIGSAMADVYGWSERTQNLWGWARWPLGVLLVLGSVTVIFRHSPRRPQPGLTWLAFGGAVTLVLWLLFTWLLGLYAQNSSTFGSTYGPLTGVMALILWSYLTSLAIFFGLAFASQLESCRTSNPGPVRPDPGP
jgi:YihY family inner membrane protein